MAKNDKLNLPVEFLKELSEISGIAEDEVSKQYIELLSEYSGLSPFNNWSRERLETLVRQTLEDELSTKYVAKGEVYQGIIFGAYPAKDMNAKKIADIIDKCKNPFGFKEAIKKKEIMLEEDEKTPLKDEKDNYVPRDNLKAFPKSGKANWHCGQKLVANWRMNCVGIAAPKDDEENILPLRISLYDRLANPTSKNGYTLSSIPLWKPLEFKVNARPDTITTEHVLSAVGEKFKVLKTEMNPTIIYQMQNILGSKITTLANLQNWHNQHAIKKDGTKNYNSWCLVQARVPRISVLEGSFSDLLSLRDDSITISKTKKLENTAAFISKALPHDFGRHSEGVFCGYTSQNKQGKVNLNIIGYGLLLKMGPKVRPQKITAPTNKVNGANI